MKRDEDGEIVAFERGDVVWGVDPFKQGVTADSGRNSEDESGIAPRPWLILSTDSIPFHPEQYLCLSLTTRTWHEHSIPLSEESWAEGGSPVDSSIMPWSLTAIQHRFLDTTGDLVARINDSNTEHTPDDGHQGRLEDEVTDKATKRVISYLEDTLTT